MILVRHEVARVAVRTHERRLLPGVLPPSALPGPRVAQRDEEEGKDGLSCGLKRPCLVDQNRSDEAHRAARKQERFQSERV
jgi:hypothetical protein